MDVGQLSVTLSDKNPGIELVHKTTDWFTEKG